MSREAMAAEGSGQLSVAPGAAVTPSSITNSSSATPSPLANNGVAAPPGAFPVAGGSGHGVSGDRTFAEFLHDHFDQVYRRVTMGRRDLKTVRAYLDARAAAEKAFADKLSKDAHSSADLTDSSSGIAVWKEVKDSAGAVAAQHQAVAQCCVELSATLDKSIKDIKSTKTSLQARYNRLTDDCKAKQQKHDKARDAYQDAVKLCEQAIQARDNGRQLPPPKQQQLDNSVSRSKTLLAQKHEDYKRAVGVLKEAQVHYDSEVVQLMQTFERTEQERLRILNDTLQRFTAQHDQLAQADAAIAAALHRSVASIDNRRDLQEFITATTTNTRPRAHVEYHAISSAIIDNAGRSASSGSAQPVAAVPMGNGQMPPPAPVGAGAFVPTGQYVAQGPAAQFAASSNIAGSSGAVKFIPPPVTDRFVPPTLAAAGGTAIALYDFDSTEADDLTFKIGDVIALKQADDAEDWWTGELRGRTGIFPKTYVQRQAKATVQPPQPAQHEQPPPQYAGTPQTAAPALLSQAAAANSAAPVASFSAAASPADGVGVGAPSPEQPRELNARCEALFDFVGQDVDELSFSKGDQLIITGELNGWYLGKVEGKDQVGIYPSNHVRVL